ncbi:Ig-like domain-containing protein [Epilithonimonas sp. UC225_85]|uniref:Ig-like domain-containing protein n=1 Tax=Epilithonimonas sp. UC225_85 TaxID=3350167 RepID=UPI0036D390D7
MKKTQLENIEFLFLYGRKKKSNSIGCNYIANIMTLLIGLMMAIIPQQIMAQQCKKVYSYTGGDQTFTVPAGITSITIKAWGAGGGGANSVYYSFVGGGAGGGYSTGTLAVTPGDVLTIRVGKGGVTSSTVATFGGGGAGGTAGQNGGSGGGLAGVFLGSGTTTPILIAGGGGGGSPGADTLNPVAGGGGGTTGGQSGAYPAGKGGTQSAGGAASTSAGNNGTAGSSLTGGKGGNANTSSNEGGGGGGGGYFGGGGGAGQGVDYNGPGGGGSSYIAYASLTAKSTTAGGNGAFNSVGGTAANNADADYAAGIGNGVGTGGPGTAGGNGRVVIIFSRTISGTSTICPGASGASQLTVTPSGGTGVTWVSSNTAVATVSSTGLVTGVAAGTATITYTDDGICTLPLLITVNATTAITGQPLTTQTVIQNAASTNLSVTAGGTGITYQWYSNVSNSNTGGTAITGATSSTYTPPTNVLGTTYYYVVVTGSCGVVTSNTSTVIVNALSSDLEVTKSVNIATSTVGSNVTFTIVAKNNGPDNNTNVVVNDLLPSGFTYVSHVATGTTYVPGTGVWTVGTLANAATRTLTVTATIASSGNYTNTAVISTTSGIADPNTSNNTASVTENVTNGVCYNNANTATVGVDSIHGITTLQRAGSDNGNWPMVRKSAHTVLESNTKGFVITRMTTTQITAIVSPQEGMMVYDTTAKCLKINSDGTAAGWNCFSTPACP